MENLELDSFVEYYIAKHGFKCWLDNFISRTRHSLFLDDCDCPILDAIKRRATIVYDEDVDANTYAKMCKFLVNYVRGEDESLYRSNMIDACAPTITVVLNGSIDLDWSGSKFSSSMVINIEKGGLRATFYADDDFGNECEGKIDMLNVNFKLIPVVECLK